MGTHPIFESDFDCLTEMEVESSEPKCKKLKIAGEDHSDSESDSGLSGSESEHTPEELFATLARKLAANTLRERNIAFAELKKFLFGKNEFSLEHNDAMRIWKGLFFMIWHSDGYQAQEDLCNQIAKFSKLFKTLKSQLAFYQGSVCILNREWMGIDRLRMDKYMLVIRAMFRATLETLQENNWNIAHINWFIGILGCSPLQHQQPTGKEGSSPLGIRYHFADIWIEELIKVGGSNSETPIDKDQVFPF